MDYIENMLTLLQMDDEPYEAVQISSPVYPSCYVKISNLTQEKIDNMLDVLYSTFKHWPEC
jgi:hypothetical protein